MQSYLQGCACCYAAHNSGGGQQYNGSYKEYVPQCDVNAGEPCTGTWEHHNGNDLSAGDLVGSGRRRNGGIGRPVVRGIRLNPSLRDVFSLLRARHKFLFGVVLVACR
jgi:hypothetical protein